MIIPRLRIFSEVTPMITCTEEGSYRIKRFSVILDERSFAKVPTVKATGNTRQVRNMVRGKGGGGKTPTAPTTSANTSPAANTNPATNVATSNPATTKQAPATGQTVVNPPDANAAGATMPQNANTSATQANANNTAASNNAAGGNQPQQPANNNAPANNNNNNNAAGAQQQPATTQQTEAAMNNAGKQQGQGQTSPQGGQGGGEDGSPSWAPDWYKNMGKGGQIATAVGSAAVLGGGLYMATKSDNPPQQ